MNNNNNKLISAYGGYLSRDLICQVTINDIPYKTPRLITGFRDGYVNIIKPSSALSHKFLCLLKDIKPYLYSSETFFNKEFQHDNINGSLPFIFSDYVLKKIIKKSLELTLSKKNKSSIKLSIIERGLNSVNFMFECGKICTVLKFSYDIKNKYFELHSLNNVEKKYYIHHTYKLYELMDKLHIDYKGLIDEDLALPKLD